MPTTNDLSSAREKFLEFLKSQNKASATILAYGKDLEQLEAFLAPKTLSGIKTVDIEAFLTKLSKENFTPKSISRKLNSIKTFYRFLKNSNLIEVNLANDIVSPKYENRAPRILSKLEYRALRDSCREDLRISAIVELFLQTGLRIGELVNLKLEDIKDNELTIKAFESHQLRTIPLNKAAKTSLDNYLKIRPKSQTKEVFLTKTGRPFLIRNIRTAIERYFRAAGIESACVNDLRHTFIAQHLANGTSVNVISKLVGHKRLSTTERYMDLVKDKVVENVRLEEL